MSDKIDLIYDIVKEHRDDIKTVVMKIDDHEKRITKVENCIGKAVAAALALASGTYGGGKLIEFMIGD